MSLEPSIRQSLHKFILSIPIKYLLFLCHSKGRILNFKLFTDSFCIWLLSVKQQKTFKCFEIKFMFGQSYLSFAFLQVFTKGPKSITQYRGHDTE